MTDISNAQLLSDFPFLANKTLVPDTDKFQEVKVDRIHLDLLRQRAGYETTSGNLVSYCYEWRFWALDKDGNILFEVQPDEYHVCHGSHEGPSEAEGESLAEALARHGYREVKYLVWRYRNEEFRGHGSPEPDYGITIYKLPSRHAPTLGQLLGRHNSAKDRRLLATC